jgi:hypothetical protein
MDLAELSKDELIDQVKTWAARVARGDYELCRLIGELDAREAWADHGVTSCAHWLSWQLGWCASTARERVRVGVALRELPLISAAFAAGRVTYSQVRAITRIATSADETKWLTLARHCTGAQLDKAARGAARAIAADRDPAQRPPTPPVRLDWDEHGDLTLTLHVPAHQAVPLLAALEQYQALEQTEREERLATLVADLSDASAEAGVIDLSTVPAARTTSPLEEYPYEEPPYPLRFDGSGWNKTPEQQATDNLAIRDWERRRDAERAIRDAWNARREQLLLEASARKLPTGRASLADALVRAVLRPADCPPVTVQLLHDPVSGWARTPHDELLPPATLEQMLAALPTKRTRRGPLAIAAATADSPLDGPRIDLDTASMTRYDLGRASRDASPALRRLLGALDGERCRFPGCPHTRHLHAHHLRFWSDGGRTDLANLVLLCSKHHRLLHNAGYVLSLDAERNLTVTSADGTVLPHRPGLPSASAEALPPADPSTLNRAYTGDRFDLGYVVNTMLSHAA